MSHKCHTSRFARELGARIKLARENANLTQKQLGVCMSEGGGVNESWRRAIYFYESGQAVPRLETLIRIADVLDVSLDDLVGREHKAVCQAIQHATMLHIPKRDWDDT